MQRSCCKNCTLGIKKDALNYNRYTAALFHLNPVVGSQPKIFTFPLHIMLIDESHSCALKKSKIREEKCNLRVLKLHMFDSARAVTLHFDFVHRTVATTKSETLQIR